MSSRRRPCGHPARITGTRCGDDPNSAAATVAAMAQRVCWEASRLCSPLQAEQWASSLLGALWMRRSMLPPDTIADYRLELGAPLIDAVAKVGGVGAKIALRGVQELDDSELGAVAGRLALKLTGLRRAIPDWLVEVGHADVTRAAVACDPVFDDGEVVFLDCSRGGDEPHALIVYIEHDIGGAAKHIGLVQPLDQIKARAGNAPRGGALENPDPLDPAVAATRVMAGLTVTDLMPGVPVGTQYASLRALAARRACIVPARANGGRAASNASEAAD